MKKKYASGTANVQDDDFLNRRSSISLDELQNQTRASLPDLNNLPQIPYGLVSQPTTEFTPFRIDNTQESTFAPGIGSTSTPDFIPKPDRETQLRDAAQLRDDIQRDLAPVKPGQRYGLKYKLNKGTEKVPGKGSGKVDTVDAKLAPGEAVLNKAAAEHLGRGFIKMLNEMGMMKMGMVEPDEEGHYACGTEEVMMKKGKK